MGIASMVIGITASLGALSNQHRSFLILISLVGIVLGIVRIPIARKQSKILGFAIAGVSLNGSAILILILSYLNIEILNVLK